MTKLLAALGLAYSFSYDQHEILRWIIKLHNQGRPFEVDPTYSKGVFYKKGVPEPLVKFDLFPQTSDTIKARADRLPLSCDSVGSLIFDPPFVAKNQKRKNAVLGKIEKRFYGFKTVPLLWDFYRSALDEFWRILRPQGVLVFKCQDMVSGGKQHMSHYEIMKHADGLGFYCKDTFVRGNKNVMISPNVRLDNQQHARKSHCYFLVFVKP